MSSRARGMLSPPPSLRAKTYDEGIARLRTIMDRDDDRIGVNARTALYVHGVRTPLSILLLHGLTNHPGQFIEFAPQLYVLGINVVVPRMPLHGYADRMTNALAGLTAEMLIAAAYEALDATAGLGDQIAVLGISMGGLLAAHIAQYRADVDTSVPLAPDFGLLRFSRDMTDALSWILLHLPNMFLWWDPRIKAAQRPATAYPRFATHALMQTLRIGNAVDVAARVTAAAAQRIVTAVNPLDPAVNNAETREVVKSWQSLRHSGVEYAELSGLPKNHDIIDPDNPLARTDVAYPKLIGLLTRTP